MRKLRAMTAPVLAAGFLAGALATAAPAITSAPAAASVAAAAQSPAIRYHS